MKKGIGILAALLLVLFASALWWSARGGGSASPDADPGIEVGVDLDAEDGPEPDRDADARDLREDRGAVSSQKGDASDARTGLVVELTWRETSEPAPGLAVTVSLLGACALYERSGRAGRDGKARFADLDAGTYRVRSDRDAEARVVVNDGRTTRCVLRLARGKALRGIVVDAAGRAVPKAEILMSAGRGRLYEEQVVTASDALGRFVVENVRGRRHVSARTKELAPCPRVLVEARAADGAYPELRLVLRHPGLRMRGRVVGPKSEPVPGARIALGWRLGFEASGDEGGAQAPSARVRSDAEGRFELPASPLGRHRLLIRARGYAPWYEYVELRPGGPPERVFHMKQGVTLEGRVSDTTGKPVAGARVEVVGNANLRSSARSASDGRYRITALYGDRLALSARAEGFDEARLVRRPPAAGLAFVWDPVLVTTRVCRGRLVDAGGRGVAGAAYQVVSEQRTRRGTTSAAGAFALAGLREGERYDFFVARPQGGENGGQNAAEQGRGKARAGHLRCAVRGRLAPGASGVEVAMPASAASKAASVTLRLDPQAQVGGPGDVFARIEQLGPGARVLTRVGAEEDASFPARVRFDGLVAGGGSSGGGSSGNYRLTIGSRADRFAIFRVAIASLRSGEQRDLGVVSPPPSAWLVLTAGTYSVLVYGEGVMTKTRSVTLRAGATETLQVALRAAAQRQLLLRAPPGVALESFSLVVKDARGRVVARDDFSGDVFWPHTWWPSLAPGSYTIDLRERPSQPRAPARRWAGRFGIEDLLPRLEPIRVDLRAK